MCSLMYINSLKKTLLIVPKSVIKQWVLAIQKIVPTKKIYVHHGQDRCRTVSQLKLKNIDIVITTFGMILNKNQDGNNIIIDFGKWDRIIIDEIHLIRNKNSMIAKQIYKIKSHIKWGLTGTPIQNAEKDLYSLYKFLDIPKCYHNKKCCCIINDKIILRRTKDEFKYFKKKIS